MHANERAFRNALKALPDHALERVIETAKTADTILTGRWVDRETGCGCLLMDGFASHHKVAALDNYDLGSNERMGQLLGELYDADEELLREAAFRFDDWAGSFHSYRGWDKSFNRRVLTDRGRARLNQILETL